MKTKKEKEKIIKGNLTKCKKAQRWWTIISFLSTNHRHGDRISDISSYRKLSKESIIIPMSLTSYLFMSTRLSDSTACLDVSLYVTLAVDHFYLYVTLTPSLFNSPIYLPVCLSVFNSSLPHVYQFVYLRICLSTNLFTYIALIKIQSKWKTKICDIHFRVCHTTERKPRGRDTKHQTNKQTNTQHKKHPNST